MPTNLILKFSTPPGQWCKIVLMQSLRRHADWWFKDLTVRRGRYVIAEPFNAPLIVFTVGIVLTVVANPGFFHTPFALISYRALVYWGVLEFKHGRSRFRKALGILAFVAVAAALMMRLGIS